MSSSSSPLSRNILLLLALLALSAAAHADVAVLTGDSITSSGVTLTNPNNALGFFNNTVATTSQWSQSGQTVTMTIQNFTQTGTVLNVTFAIRMSASGTWANDQLNLQYTNDSVTYSSPPGSPTQPGSTLTTYGNYSVYSTFPTVNDINNAVVRLSYSRSQGSDGITSSVDAVEFYVTYAPPPTVTLTWPQNNTFVASKTFGLNYTPSSLISFSGCSLYINGTLNATNATAISNGTNNTINTTVVSDGTYLWNVTCTDTSGFSGTATSAWIVKVDTTAPNVSLVQPQNGANSTRPLNNFTFNVSDMATIASCILVVDGTQRNSTSSPARDTNLNMSASLAGGTHSWYVNCTDANGWIGQSETRNITINLPFVTPNPTSYNISDIVLYTGGNWDPGATVNITTTLANGTNISNATTANATGGVTATLYLNYSFPAGTYNVSAVQTNDSTKNGTANYTVNARTATITASAASYLRGSLVTLTGLNFSPNGNVNITIAFAGGANQTTVVANSTGGFVYNYTLLTNETIGRHNATANDTVYRSLNASTWFNVTAPPAVSTLNMTPSTVVLNAGSTKGVQCNFTVDDPDGAGDITGANATFYAGWSSSGADLSNFTNYANASCTVTSSNATAKRFTCGVDLLYYAANGTWTCNATGMSNDASRSNTTNFTIDPLYAINVSYPLLDFGAFAAGGTSAELEENLSNMGNQQINVSVLGYGNALGDGYAFVCANGTIPIGAMRFSDSIVSYALKSSLAPVFQQMNITIQAQVNPSPQTRPSYWQVAVPDGSTQGSCNGTIVFQADMS